MSTKSKKWYYKDPEHARRLARGYYHAQGLEARAKEKVNNVKQGARVRHIPYELPRELAVDLVTDNCYYCGAAPEPFNGIDRVDNQRGYVEDNVVSCCKYCNAGKLERPRAEFEAWVFRAAKHLGQFTKLHAEV